MNGMAASDKIFSFLNEEEPKKKTIMLSEDNLGIELKNVSFSYDDEKEVLQNISMQIKPKTFTGIVGESGSGKSTIASILMGRNTVSSGSVTIGDVEISEVLEESLLKKITYVGLGSVFFKGTVKENLLLAKPDATEKELWDVLFNCNIAEFFKSENGLETELLENAENLSGGQRQRLALARALLHNSEIYIFDEATSNIDMESEDIILKVIQKLATEKTIIMITHRLANVKNANQIVCLENGKQMGVGTHESLMENCKTYERLWKTQEELERFGKEEA